MLPIPPFRGTISTTIDISLSPQILTHLSVGPGFVIPKGGRGADLKSTKKNILGIFGFFFEKNLSILVGYLYWLTVTWLFMAVYC